MSQKIESWTHYNEWGEITHNAVLKCGQRELDLVKNYTGHDYDSVLSQYYAKARMYDAGDRRFTSMDPVKGNVAEPLTLIQYIYVANNPLIYIDPLGNEYDRGGGSNTYYPPVAPTATPIEMPDTDVEPEKPEISVNWPNSIAPSVNWSV